MHDQVAVRIVHRVETCRKRRSRESTSNLRESAVVVERLPFHELGDQIRIAGGGNAAVQQPCDVVVVERSHQLALDFESPEELGSAEVRGHDLQRHPLFKLAVGALPAIDDARASAPQQSHRAIGAELRCWQRQFRGRGTRSGTAHFRICFQ